MRHDLAYLKRLSDEIDKLAAEKSKPLDPERATQLADLKDYFFYLFIDAMQDRELVMHLVEHFEHLEAQSLTHHRFFFAMGQLLSTKHEIHRVPGEEISREAFECSFKRTAEELGL